MSEYISRIKSSGGDVDAYLQQVFLQQGEPDQSGNAGAIWLQENASHQITAIKSHNSSGTWTTHTISAGVAPGSAGGSGTTISTGSGAPDEGTPQGIYIDVDTGDLYEWS